MSARKLLSLLAVLSFVVVFCPTSSYADEVAGNKAITFGPVNSNSIYSPSTNPANSGINTESVNLYTGQYQESFPLVAVGGRGGNGVTITLDYNGNVTSRAKQETRLSQASPFGLGFSVGGQSIVCDHNSTTTLADDTYQLIINGTGVTLKYVENDYYVPANGNPWQIYRHTATVGGISVIIGWTVKTEDGTVYKFGDFDTTVSEYNATRYIFHYGNFVGNGVTNDESLYPYTWDLSEIGDPDALNVTTFDYWQETAAFQVKDVNSQNTLVTSPHSYTRASYLDSITTPEGSRVRFTYSDRTDTQPFYDYNIYEFFSTKKADRLEVVSSTDEVLSVTRFTYDYLLKYYNDEDYGPFQKLILTRVDNLPGDESDIAPPLSFEYFLSRNDAAFGAIKEVHYSSGSIKKVYYSELDTAENMTELHANVDGSGPTEKQYMTRNLYVNIDNDNDCRIAYWDGTWHEFHPNMFFQDMHQGYVDFDLNQDDIPGVSPDGWVAIYSRHLESLMVWKWKGGYFEIDTIATPFTRGSNRIGIYPTKDAFVVTVGGYGDDGAGKPMRRISQAYYYRWEGEDWVPYLIDNSVGGRSLSGVQVHNNTFAISYYSGGGSHMQDYTSYMRYGAYDNDANPPALVCEPVADFSGSLIGGKFAVGPNSVGFQAWAVYETVIDIPLYSYTVLCKFEDSQWSVTSLNYPTNLWRVGRGIRSVPNGFVYAIDNDDRGHQSFIRGAFYSSNGWIHTSCRLSADQYSRQVGELHGSGHYVFTQNICNKDDSNCGNTDANIWRWDGVNYAFKMQVEHNPANSHYAEVFNNSYAWGSNMYFIGPITGRQYLGNNTWSGTILNTPTQQSNRYAASENFAVCNLTSTSNLFQYRPFYQGIASNYVQRTVRTNTSTVGRFYAADDVFYINAHYDYSSTHDIYKLVDTLFTGPAKIVVVDSVAVYEHSSDSDPKRIQYAYHKGLVGQDGVTPKFTKSAVSLPYFASEGGPEGWNVTYYYNDSSHISISDGHYATTITYPNFDSLPMPPYYGRHNGGYILDGLPYLTYTYSADSGLSEVIDYTQYFYTIKPTADTLEGVFRKFLVKKVTSHSGINDTTLFTYDEYNHQLKSKTTYYKKGVSRKWKIEQTTYANNDLTDTVTANAMKADNAIVQVLSRTTTMNDYYNNDTLSAVGTRYAKHGHWIPVEDFTWRDYGNRNDTTVTRKAVEFDAFGNRLSYVDIEGKTSSVKYDVNGSRTVASGKNCTPIQLYVQDFEQGTDWDGWASWNLGGARSFDEDAFTGEYSFKLTDNNPGNIAHIWSPNKKVSGYDFNTTDYYFSAWVKANHMIRVFCFTFDSNGDQCSNETLEFTGLDSTKWQKIEGVFSGALSPGCWDSVGFRWILVDETENPAPANAFVKMDNVRLHPIDAHVTTTVYDKSTGVVTAELGLNNIPKRFEYDGFQRPVATKNYKDELISKEEYYNSRSTENLYVNFAGYIYSDATTITFDQTITFEVRGQVTTHFEDFAEYTIYVNDTVAAHYHYGPQSGIYNFGSLNVNAGDYVRITVTGFSLNGFTNIYLRLWYNVYDDFDPSDPHRKKTTLYSSGDNGYDSLVSISYFNSVGENIQTRTLHYLPNGTSQAALVNGMTVYDGRGRVVRKYNPYYDIVSSSGVANFTPLSQVPSECNTYYDGTNDYNCQGYPYSELVYDHDVKGRLRETSQPGNDWRIGGGHTSTVSYDEIVTSSDHLFTSVMTDPDGIVSKSVKDNWNLISYDSVSYTDQLGNPAITFEMTYRNVYGLIDSAAISDGVSSHVLRRYWNNDVGLQDSAWVMDYGTVRKMYDRSGNLRFIKNDKLDAQGLIIYYKYDSYSRKIEEGTIPNGWFVQALADMPTFPDVATMGGTVKYTWVFDRNGSQVNYGSLLYTSDGDSSYYQQYNYFPFEYKDSVVTQLNITNGDLKSVVHEYDCKNGQLEKKVVYPYESTTGVRSYDYNYDLSGRVKSIQESSPDDSPLGYTRNYAEYDYFLGSRVKRKLLGVYNGGARNDTVQVLDYYYNALGMLTGINNPDSIDYGSGLGEANPHFGLLLDYTNGGTGYYNGRIARAKTVNSTSSSYKGYEYNYTYNELGWLTGANNTLGSGNDRLYFYNFLGNRDSVNFGGTVKRYNYGAGSGSSQLTGFNGGPQKRFYDEVGNLYQDDVNDVYLLDYDYRNLIDYAQVKEFHTTTTPQELWFDYNSSGQRIMKKFFYAYKAPCGGPDIDYPHVEISLPEGGKDGSSIPSGSSERSAREFIEGGTDKGGLVITYCVFYDTTETHYLYDGGTLVMTFDKDDNVNQSYVKGKGSNVAVYPENDNAQLAYQISDQVGSTRLLVDESGNIKQYIFYHPFGEIMDQWVSYDEPLKFGGKEFDDHSTFDYYYYGSRYYDPRVGQFTSVDRSAQFASGYVFCGNNPIMYVDPDGNFSILAAIKLAVEIYFIAKATYDGYQEDGIWGAIRNGIIAAATVYAANEAGSYIGDNYSRIGGIAASSGIYSAGNRAMYNTPWSIDFGIVRFEHGSKPDWANPFGKEGNFFERMGDLAGWLALGEDLNRYLPDGKTQGWDFDEETGIVTDPEGNQYQISEEALERARMNPGAHFTVDGDLIDNPLQHPPNEGNPGINIRFAGRGPGPGGLHADYFFEGAPDGGPAFRFHWDAYASLNPEANFRFFQNIGTGIQHIFFESFAFFVGVEQLKPMEEILQWMYQDQGALRESGLAP